MKSWGERVLAGLKNWRSRRNGSATDEMPDGESVAEQSPEASDHEPEAKLSIKVTAKEFDRTGAKEIPQIEPANPSAATLANGGEAQTLEASSSQTEPMTEEEVDENAAIPRFPTPEKRSRLRKPKTTDGQVTDEELAELEAENARLKLLLSERMKAKQNDSDN